MADDRIKFGVLWKNLSREGNRPYLSGRVQEDNLDNAMRLLRDGGRFLVLGNTKRPDKKDPDYVLYVVPERERPDNGDAARHAVENRAPSAGGRRYPSTTSSAARNRR